MRENVTGSPSWARQSLVLHRMRRDEDKTSPVPSLSLAHSTWNSLITWEWRGSAGGGRGWLGEMARTRVIRTGNTCSAFTGERI